MNSYKLGSLLIGGNGAPDERGNLQSGDTDYHFATDKNWKQLTDNI